MVAADSGKVAPAFVAFDKQDCCPPPNDQPSSALQFHPASAKPVFNFTLAKAFSSEEPSIAQSSDARIIICVSFHIDVFRYCSRWIQLRSQLSIALHVLRHGTQLDFFYLL